MTGAVGAVAIRQTHERCELPLALVPLFFAVQQAIEGLIWLTLPLAQYGMVLQFLTYLFLFFALCFWPVFAPVAVFCIERVLWRQRAILVCIVMGAAVSLYLASILISSAVMTTLKDGHIIYGSDPFPHRLAGIFYLLATGFGPALSSHRSVNALAIVVLIGSVVAWVVYWDSFISVWCFFAAGASLVILLHFLTDIRRSRMEKMGHSV